MGLAGPRAAYGDVPTVIERFIQFGAPPESMVYAHFTVRHLNPSQSHYIDRIQVEIDGVVHEFTPIPWESQMGKPEIDYTFQVEAAQGSVIRTRSRCNLHDWSSWTPLNARLYKLTVAAPDGYGSTDPVSGSYSYSKVVPVPMTATPAPGWGFSHWILDGVDIGDENPYTVTMDSDHTIKAVFTGTTPPPQTSYRLTVAAPEGSGSTDPVTGTYNYKHIVTVPVTAVPAQGWGFSHWLLDGLDIGDQNPYTVTMDTDHSIKAVFVEPPTIYRLTVAAPEGSGSTDPATGTYTYEGRVSVSLTAAPASGWVFSHWVQDGANKGVQNPCTVVMDSDHTLKAVFKAAPPQGIPGYPVESLIGGALLLCIVWGATRRESFRPRWMARHGLH